MKFPKLKHPLLCRICSYVAVIGAFVCPMVTAVCIPWVPESVKAVVSIACMVALIGYLMRNFVFLMGMDILLGSMQGCARAYRQYPLEAVCRKRLCRFGRQCQPISLQPQPQLLRCKSSAPITVYSSGIEKVVAVYRCALLTKSQFHSIVSSGVANSQALAGKKKHLLLDKAQKTAPRNRVTVILILATAVEPGLSEGLYDLVCKQDADGFDTAVLPCVVDLASKTCVFSSQRLPYVGYQYPVKNRGIRLIEKYVFGGRFPRGQGSLLEGMEDFDPEMTLWSLWRHLKRELRDEDQKTKKQFRAMTHGQVLVREDWILLKWEDRGVECSAAFSEDGKTVTVEAFDTWDYPKIRPMSKKHITELETLIRYHFAQAGGTVRFITPEEEANE